MTAQRTYPHGVPCWIDTEQPDQAEASRFYGALFGWSFEEAMPPGAPGSYLIAKLDGVDVAAIGAASGPAATWNTYISVDDADSMVGRVTDAGGRVVSPPQDAGPGGRAATFTDPNDVEFRVWQARLRRGAQVVNAPNSWNFSDLHTAEIEAARAFYGQVFGWQADDLDFGDGQPAVMWRRPGYGDHLAATIDPDMRHLHRQPVHATRRVSTQRRVGPTSRSTKLTE